MVEMFKAAMPLWVLRAAFLVVAAGLGVTIARVPAPGEGSMLHTWGVFVGVMFAAIGIIVIDIVFPRKRLDLITCVYFGIIVGLFLTYVVGIALTPILDETNTAAGN